MQTHCCRRKRRGGEAEMMVCEMVKVWRLFRGGMVKKHVLKGFYQPLMLVKTFENLFYLV